MNHMRSSVLTLMFVAPVFLGLACAGPDGDEIPDGETEARAASPLPDPSGWGTQVLAVAVAPDGAVWVGTYGDGIYVSRDGTGADWEHIASSADSTSIS